MYNVQMLYYSNENYEPFVSRKKKRIAAQSEMRMKMKG